jgi:hypothetical protein
VGKVDALYPCGGSAEEPEPGKRMLSSVPVLPSLLLVEKTRLQLLVSVCDHMISGTRAISL